MAPPGGKRQACQSLQRAFCTVESQAKKLKRAMELSGHSRWLILYGLCFYFLESLFCRAVEGPDERYGVVTIMFLGTEDIGQSLGPPLKNRLMAFGDAVMKVGAAALPGDSGQQYWKNTGDFLLQVSKTYSSWLLVTVLPSVPGNHII